MKELKFGSGENSFSKESRYYVSCNNIDSFDYLIFVDSRGLVINENTYENSYLHKLMEFLDSVNSSYICISRPKNLTVYATLYNFLILNNFFNFKNLITNLGFVDCTPKKESNIDDIEEQINENIAIRFDKAEQEYYMLNNGEQEMLKTLLYSDKYIDEIANMLNSKFNKLYFINTPEISINMSFKRKRPNSFFAQLEKTNELIELIIKRIEKPLNLIDIKNLSSTYDGVHFDKMGHEKIFTELKERIS